MNRAKRSTLEAVLLLVIAAAIAVLDPLIGPSAFAQAAVNDAAAQQQIAAPEQTRNSPTEIRPPASGPLDEKAPKQTSEDFGKLRGEIETIKNILFYGGGFLALIVAVLTIQSSALAWLSDRRTAASHALAIKGEEASQKRAETIHERFLDESHKTIGLVNATLQLAKDATERTTKVWEERASANLKQLDERAKSLLSDITIERARDLVRDVAQQEKIKALAQDITLFESNRLFFAEKFPLTPYCRFVRGVYSHMTQDFPDAISEWEAIRIDTSSPTLLVALASYWIAVEYDSLGSFEKAISTFESTRSYVEGVARFDIERLIIESTFSRLPDEQAETLIKPLEQLFDVANKEADSRAKTYVIRRINIALGNILLQVGKHQRKKDSRASAEQYFRRAAEKFGGTAEQDQWALLGLAEALYYLGETAKACDIFAHRAKQNAELGFKRRKEPRSQVLAKTAELICCVRVPNLRDSIPSVNETLTRTLIDVHPRLTVYSAFAKRNVFKETFEAQLKEFMSDYELGLDTELDTKPLVQLASNSPS